MMWNKVAPTSVFATAKAFVWWDMDTCPLPNGYDPHRIGPRIDTELRNLGYKGPLTIIAVGDLDGISDDFLKALSSTGVVIKQTQTGMFDEVLLSESHTPPMTILLISEPHILESLSSQFCGEGYNLLFAYPPSTSPYPLEAVHPSSLRVSGEWLWNTKSLLKGSAEETRTTRLDMCEMCEMFSCDTCFVDFPTFEDFSMHLHSPEHAREIESENKGIGISFKQSIAKMEKWKNSKDYANQVAAKDLDLDLDLKMIQEFEHPIPKVEIVEDAEKLKKAKELKKASKKRKGKKKFSKKPFKLCRFS